MQLARPLVPATVLLAFTALSVHLVGTDDYAGFLRLAARDPWALQMLCDLGIACTTVLVVWVVPDARRRGIAPWPYVGATLLFGSLGLLAYLVHREARSLLAARPRGAVSAPAS